MKIRIVTVGNVRESFLREGIGEYLKRLKPFLPVELSAVQEAKCDGAEKKREMEGRLLLKKVEGLRAFFVLDEKGEEMDTHSFAMWLDREIKCGTRNLGFIVGGAFGLSEEVKMKASRILALSRMTFTHEMALLLLVEQIYRAVKILRGEPYHH